MRSWLMAILLLAVALGGCTETPDEPADGGDGGGDGGDDSGNDGGNGTAGPGTGEGNNTAPTANLTADILNGTAPLAVNLTIDGSDADGDNLTWSLSLGGNETANGTTLPASVNLTLEAGNWTFVLLISDGNLTATANLTIMVAEPGDAVPEGPCGAEPEPCKVDEDRWVEFWTDGSCRAKPAFVRTVGPVHYNDRPADGSQNGLVSGGGTWVYEETNGEPGLWLHKDEGGAYGTCVNGDTIIF